FPDRGRAETVRPFSCRGVGRRGPWRIAGKRDGDALLLGIQAQDRRLAPAARGGIPVESRIPASERTSQKLKELLTQGGAEGDARSELIKLAVRKIVEEALEAEVAEALGRGYYENGATPGAGYRNGY